MSNINGVILHDGSLHLDEFDQLVARTVVKVGIGSAHEKYLPNRFISAQVQIHTMNRDWKPILDAVQLDLARKLR